MNWRTTIALIEHDHGAPPPPPPLDGPERPRRRDAITAKEDRDGTPQARCATTKTLIDAYLGVAHDLILPTGFAMRMGLICLSNWPLQSRCLPDGSDAGVLYALVALGFVLIYKPRGIFNYAQAVMAPVPRPSDPCRPDHRTQVPFSHLINAILGTRYPPFRMHVRRSLRSADHGGDDRSSLCGQRLCFAILVGQEPNSFLFMATISVGLFPWKGWRSDGGSEHQTMDVGPAGSGLNTCGGGGGPSTTPPLTPLATAVLHR